MLPFFSSMKFHFREQPLYNQLAAKMKPQALWTRTRQKHFDQDRTFTDGTFHMHHLQPRRKKRSHLKETGLLES